MSNLALKSFVTPEEYLASERTALEKHEYINGEIYAMAGVSLRYDEIVRNIAFLLIGHLRGSSCAPFSSDVRIFNPSSGSFLYPDLSVICGKPITTDAHVDTVINPQIIIEVLSPSTELYDRVDKFTHYKLLASLKEYVLVSQNQARVEKFTRRGEVWELSESLGLESVLTLESILFSAPLSEIYYDIALPDPPPMAPKR